MSRFKKIRENTVPTVRIMWWNPESTQWDGSPETFHEFILKEDLNECPQSDSAFESEYIGSDETTSVGGEYASTRASDELTPGPPPHDTYGWHGVFANFLEPGHLPNITERDTLEINALQPSSREWNRV